MDGEGTIRAVVFQDDMRRGKEIDTLYSGLTVLESCLEGTAYNRYIREKMSKEDAETAEMLDISEGQDGRTVVERRRRSISAKENKCGRFAVMTSSGLPWKDLPIRYRPRNEVGSDFSQLRSDLFVGVCGKSDRDSAEGGLLVDFLSLRPRITLIERLKETSLADRMWVPDVIDLLKKLKMSCIGVDRRLNEVTRLSANRSDSWGSSRPDRILVIKFQQK